MKRLLKNTDFNIFPIIMGSDYFGGAISEQTAFENLDLYTEYGGNIIDTARLYVDGKSEEIIGRYLKERNLKNKIVISTKAAHPPLENMNINRLSRTEIEKDIDTSLSLLGVDAIDILWLHRDDHSVPVETIVDTMDVIIKKGKVKYWGVSNWQSKRMEEANKYAKENNMPQIFGGQIQWSLAKPSHVYDTTLVAMNTEEAKYYKKYDSPVFAFASQGKGFFEKYDQNCLSEKARERYYCEENIKTYHILKKISNETGYSLTALGLAYLIGQKDFDTFPIIGCTKSEYVTKAVEALKVDKDTIDELLKINL
ncbi:MAG: aldo/keto reductase [Clostridia bacterium]|nr:aldo/keto reductase [Clostridia bacterium]